MQKRPFGIALFIALLLLVLSPAAPLRAQEKAVWNEDLPKALTQAKSEKKLVFVDFTGSDWCSACLVAEKEFFTNPAFTQFAQAHLVLVRLDFPQEKPQDPELRKRNRALAAQYNPEGKLPLFMVLNADGKVLTMDEGYAVGSGPSLIEALKKLKG